MATFLFFIQWIILAALYSAAGAIVCAIIVGFLPKTHPLHELFAAFVKRMV